MRVLALLAHPHTCPVCQEGFSCDDSSCAVNDPHGWELWCDRCANSLAIQLGAQED